MTSSASGRLRKSLLLGVIVAASAATAIASSGREAESVRAEVERMVDGDARGPLYLVAEQLVGGREWKVFAYLDRDGRPCLVESFGGGGCHPYAERIRGEIADYSTSGASWHGADGTGARYVVVRGTVPPYVREVSVEFAGGTVERVAAQALPGFDVRVFALLSEGPTGRRVEEVRAAR